MNNSSRRLKYIQKYFNINSKTELIKIFIISICFFIILGAYTIIRELKDSIFILIVGKNYIPDIKTLSCFLMFPLTIFYSWLSIRIERHMLLIFYSLIYGLGGCILAYYLSDPIVGLLNPISSPLRIFGWIFYLFLEGYSPFIVCLIWAFFNSISNPGDLKNNYIIVTTASKIGGFLFALFAWLFMSKQITFGYEMTDANMYSFLMGIASIALLLVPICIYILYKVIPKKQLSGYSINNEDKKKENSSFFSGFSVIFKNVYVLGIFGMIFFWEVVNVIFNYMRLSIGFAEAESISGFSAILYKQIMLMHLIGLFFVLFGTSSVVKYCGEKVSLMLIPILTGTSIFICMYYQSTSLITFTYIFVRAINYSFAYPLREALYIPTSQDIQFRAKSWIDSVGSKLSKGFGSGYNKVIQFIPIESVNLFQNSFFIFIILSWTIGAFLLGKKWEKTIKDKKIII